MMTRSHIKQTLIDHGVTEVSGALLDALAPVMSADDKLAVAREAERAELLRWARLDFENALEALPSWAKERLAKNEQFNAYESASNDDDDDPDYWAFYLSLGPIDDAAQILEIEGEWRAKLIEAALRVALRSRFEAQARLVGERNGKWQPIETHDGSTDECLIALLDGHGRLYIADRGWWVPGDTHEEWDEVEEGVRIKLWEDQEDGYWSSNHGCLEEPTHWMPLEPPAIRKEAASIKGGSNEE